MFRFKQFAIDDSQCAMKIGTDAVLLGSVSALYPSDSVLDIGAGCGIIALMIAQKSKAKITAIDLDADAVAQAHQNFNNTRWGERMFAIHQSLSEFMEKPVNHPFDLMVCNPPFFVQSTPAPHFSRNIARHTVQMNHEDIFRIANKLLSKNGRLIIIFPPELEKDMEENALKNRLYSSEKLYIHPTPRHSLKRIIAHYGFNREKVLQSNRLNIHEYDKRNQFTSEYRNLTFDYHPFFV